MKLEDIEAATAELRSTAYLATVRTTGEPDVVPVVVAWEGDAVWFAASSDSAKIRNIAANPRVALHWQVNDAGDGVMIWGTAKGHIDVETKQRLWEGVFDYDLNQFMPEGPTGDGTTLVSIEPTRALIVKQFGAGPRFSWRPE